MKPITISAGDVSNYDDFMAGNSIQVRVEVAESEIRTFVKNKVIKVIHEGNEGNAKIVSDPLVVTPSSEKGPKTLSLIIEKAD